MITLENVSFAYDDSPDRYALKNLSLHIKKGSFVSVLGHNGSGKSTLAKLLNAIALPTEGTVFIDGQDSRDKTKISHIRSSVGMVFQNPDNQIVASVVEEDVAFGLENLGIPSVEIRARVDEALSMVGMTQFKTHAPHLLSGGQKQRIAIAGVVAMRPQCIIFDESTAMLDPVGRLEIMHTIEYLHQEFGITVILITHHMEEASLSERLIVLSEGEVIADDAPAVVIQNHGHLRAHKHTAPDTVLLLHALREEGLTLPLDAISDERCAEALFSYFTDAK